MPGYLRSWDSTCTALLSISYHPNHWFTKALQCPWMQNLWTWLFIFYVVKWARHEWLAYRITCHSYTMWPHFSYSRMWSHTHGQSIFFVLREGGEQLESLKHACHRWAWPPPEGIVSVLRSLPGDGSAMTPCRVYCLLYTGHTKPLMYELITKDTLLPRRCVAWSCLNRALFLEMWYIMTTWSSSLDQSWSSQNCRIFHNALNLIS